jgi:diguanylate cyclase (GGDEF)-like protein
MLNILLKNIAQKKNLFAQGDTLLEEIVALMSINNKGAVVILDKERPIGIMTERDIIAILHRGGSLEDRVDTFARKSLIAARRDRALIYALNLMVENNVRRIVVHDEINNFVGLVTQKDLLKYLEEDCYRSTLKAKDVIRKTGHLINASPDDSLKDILGQMAKNHISSVAIVNESVAEGIISEWDILKLAVRKVSFHDKVKEYMSTPVLSAHIETPVVDIVTVMNTQNIRRVVILDDEGIAINIITVRDIIHSLGGDYRDFLERKLRNAKEILNLFPELLIEIFDMEQEQFISWANEKTIQTFGSEILGRPVTDLIPEESWEQIYHSVRLLKKIENMRIKKENKIYEVSGFCLVTEHHLEKNRIQLILKDITSDIRLSVTDPLTGIHNRRYMNEYLAKEIERCRRLEKNFSLVICDIDNFHETNDLYGHINGDTVLKSLAQIIKGTVRTQDSVGRYGGDEFALILPETSNGDASEIIDRLRMKIESIKIMLPRKIQLTITASFGVATYPQDGNSADDMLVKADERLHKAKKLGKNMVVFI